MNIVQGISATLASSILHASIVMKSTGKLAVIVNLASIWKAPSVRSAATMFVHRVMRRSGMMRMMFSTATCVKKGRTACHVILGLRHMVREASQFAVTIAWASGREKNTLVRKRGRSSHLWRHLIGKRRLPIVLFNGE